MLKTCACAFYIYIKNRKGDFWQCRPIPKILKACGFAQIAKSAVLLIPVIHTPGIFGGGDCLNGSVAKNLVFYKTSEKQHN